MTSLQNFRILEDSVHTRLRFYKTFQDSFKRIQIDLHSLQVS